MIYVFKMNEDTRDDIYEYFLNKKAKFKGLGISVSETIDKENSVFNYRHINFKTINKEYGIDLDHTYYVEALYILYNDNTETFTIINEDNLKFLKEVIDYKLIDCEDFSVINH